ncbi:hypothetical protein [Domibacillus enclensis]|uniref:hypothetical protein n=1 Tax=Domibacillus enclensis TaxID=1017273 RepID=UPI001E2918BC|nr:hypothetical protein [Domibacillus enclensis]
MFYLFFAVRLFKNKRTGSVLFLLPVIAGLVYDNGILAAGRFIGEGPILESLNYARFWIHAFLTPLLVLFAWKTLQQAGVQWAQKTWARITAFLLTTSLIGLELFTEVFGLVIQPEQSYGVLSYGKVESASGPPVMVLIVSVVLLGASILIWRKQGWLWFFVGSFVMIVGSAVQLPVKSGAVTNLFELVPLSSLVATARFQSTWK